MIIRMQHCTTPYSNTHRSCHTQLIKSMVNISTVEAFGGNSAFGTPWDFTASNQPLQFTDRRSSISSPLDFSL